jgi:hypothetical protein
VRVVINRESVCAGEEKREGARWFLHVTSILA